MLQELVWSLLFYSTLYEVQTLVMLLDLFWNHFETYIPHIITLKSSEFILQGSTQPTLSNIKIQKQQNTN